MPSKMLGLKALYWSAFFVCSSVTSAFAGGAPTMPLRDGAKLSRSEVPANAKASALLEVERFGRYALLAQSKTGVALRVTSRMDGPGGWHGRAGVEDGRADAFFDRGTYKVDTRGDLALPDSARAQLKLRTFIEQNGERPPELVELRELTSTLEDFQQRSYWLRIPKGRLVHFEAAGRALGDMRLWRDGSWLVEGAPSCEDVPATEGRPLRRCRLHRRLEEGLYLLTLYGGKPRDWAAGGQDWPLYLRWGTPSVPATDRRRYVLGPTGEMRLRIGGRATHVRVELPTAVKFSAAVHPWDPERPFRKASSWSRVTKESNPPVAVRRMSRRSGKGDAHLLILNGPPGQAFLLQHLDVQPYFEVSGEGDYYLGTIHTGDARDNIDATGVLASGPRSSRKRKREPPRVVAQDALELSPDAAWRRRFNLLQKAELIFEVAERGRFRVVGEGVDVRFRVSPLILRPEQEKLRGKPRPSGHIYELDAGVYRLSIEPWKSEGEPGAKGILDLTIAPVSSVGAMLGRMGVGAATQVPEAPPQGGLHFEQITLDPERSYLLMVAAQPDVQVGLVQREVPIDLSHALPISLQPGQSLSLLVDVPESGVLRVVAEDGRFLDASVDNGRWRPEQGIRRGLRSLEVRNRGDQTVFASVALLPRSMQPGTPLPELPDAALRALPDFPLLEAGAPTFLDLDRGAQSTWLVKVDQPGLYQLQSTGLLATRGNLRTRTVTSLTAKESNGVGRNFMLQQYLREGEYQLTVGTRGRSTGHLGVALEGTRMVEGGELHPGTPARIALPAGEAVRYTFEISEPAHYLLQAQGLGRNFRCRLEDAEGWPIEVVNAAASFRRKFEPGRYQLILLPEPVDTRRVTLLEAIEPDPSYKGHGPHALRFGQRVRHTWREPGKGERRRPDHWEFVLPAPAPVKIQLSGEMEARVLRAEGKGGQARYQEVAYVPPSRGYAGELEAGRYRIAAQCVRENDHYGYSLSLDTEHLLPGVRRQVRLPAERTLAVGERGLVELSSFGSVDVAAELVSADGRVIAQSDDRPGDWNFHIAATLDPGAYQLKVRRVGSGRGGATELRMHAPALAQRASMAPGTALSLSPGEGAIRRAITLPPLEAPALLVLAAHASESVGISIEGEGRSLATATGMAPRIALPVAPGGPALALRVWSVDRRGNPVQLSLQLPELDAQSESDFEDGLELTAVVAAEPPLGVAKVALDRPGVFTLLTPPRGMRFAATPWQPAQPGRAANFVASGNALWVVADDSAGRPRAQRLRLGSGADAPELALRLPASTVAALDVEAPEGPLIVWSRARGGQPGAKLVDEAAAEQPTPSGAAVGVGPGLAVSALLDPDDPVAVLWHADAAADVDFDLRARARAFPEPELRALNKGHHAGPIAPGAAIAMRLPDGLKRVRLSTGPGLVAVLSHGSRVASVHGGSDRALSEWIEGDADRLTLLNPAAQSGHFSAEIASLPAAALSPTVAPGAPFELRAAEAGTRRLFVAPGGAQLRARSTGAPVADPVFVDRRGRVSRGWAIDTAGESGTLLLSHGPGLALAWFEGGRGQWGTAAAAQRRRLPEAGVITLGGAAQAFELSADAPRLVHLRSAQPVVSRVKRPGGEVEVALHEEALRLDLWLPAGESELTLRGVAGAPLFGELRVTQGEIPRIAEGLGEPLLLAPGELRVFRFELAEDATVGVGVRAEDASVEALLLNAQGQLQGRGVVLQRELTAGTWLLGLRAPSEAAPSLAQPAVVGIAAPSKGPPEKEIRRYLKLAGAELAEGGR